MEMHKPELNKTLGDLRHNLSKVEVASSSLVSRSKIP